jgi:SAM-dependent methyltransferase
MRILVSLKDLFTNTRWETVITRLYSQISYSSKTLRLKQHRKALLSYSPKERFTAIYDTYFWHSVESRSGRGSEYRNTENIRSELPIIIDKFEICSIVDAACGDFNWMRYIIPSTAVSYTGLDIVDSVIAKNNRNYASSNINFFVADICHERIPSCDLLIVRDCLIHMSYDDINDFFKNVSMCEYRYLLTTTYVDNTHHSIQNRDIATGGHRKIDIFAPPFNFTRDDVLYTVADYREGLTPRLMVLFDKKSVPTHIDSSET